MNSKRKGKRGELEFVRLCKSQGYEARRTAQYCGKTGEATRDTKEKNRRYYAAHAEQARQRARERYWADPEGARADNRYQREKRRILSEAV